MKKPYIQLPSIFKIIFQTGTLTEWGLELWGIVPCVNNEFETSIKDPSTVDDRSPLIVALATCHSLTRIDGKLSGDPLDFSIFNALDWVNKILVVFSYQIL